MKFVATDNCIAYCHLPIAQMQPRIAHSGPKGQDTAHGFSVYVAAKVHETAALCKHAAAVFGIAVYRPAHTFVSLQSVGKQFGIASRKIEYVTRRQHLVAKRREIDHSAQLCQSIHIGFVNEVERFVVSYGYCHRPVVSLWL